jgi:hypothetical protein
MVNGFSVARRMWLNPAWRSRGWVSDTGLGCGCVGGLDRRLAEVEASER